MAAAVLRQAMFDLRRRDRATLEDAADAADFLLRRLWQEDNFWGELVADRLPRRRVAVEVAQTMGGAGRAHLGRRGQRMLRDCGLAA